MSCLCACKMYFCLWIGQKVPISFKNIYILWRWLSFLLVEKRSDFFTTAFKKKPKQPLPCLLRRSSSLQDCEAAFASASRWRRGEVGCCGMPDGHNVTHRVFLPHMPHEEFPNQLPSRYIYQHSALCLSVNEGKSQLPTAARRWTWKAGKRQISSLFPFRFETRYQACISTLMRTLCCLYRLLLSPRHQAASSRLFEVHWLWLEDRNCRIFSYSHEKQLMLDGCIYQ